MENTTLWFVNFQILTTHIDISNLCIGDAEQLKKRKKNMKMKKNV